jgi:threonine dehydratase
MAHSQTEIPDRKELLSSRERVGKYAHHTPVLTNSGLNDLSGAELYFKCENFQKVGAFKFRGAVNTVFQLPEEYLQQGVATHSSGNHGQAVALAAKMKGIPAYIVMPENSTRVKIEAVKGYGAKVLFCENSLQAREDKLYETINETGAYFIHPYDDYRVIAGQSTAAQELMEDCKDLDIIVTPIGGGGLISGTLLAANYFSRGVKVIGGEPKGADSAFLSFANHKWVKVNHPNTVCDGLRASIGEKNFEIIDKYIEQIYRVSDRQALEAMKLIWERMKIVIEPSCAVPLAVILANPDYFAGKKTGVILTGGNVDLSALAGFFKD